MDKLRELEIELNYIRWRKSECIYKSEWEKAALLREKENNLLLKLEHLMGSEYIKSNYLMIRVEGKYYNYPLDAENDEEAFRIITAKLNATKEKNFTGISAEAKAAAAAAAAAAAYNSFPIVSECREIIWKNIFHHFPIPINERELTNLQIKEWSYQILEKIKEEIPSVPLESIPDPEDDKILCILTKKYKPNTKSLWIEIVILSKIATNFNQSNDNEIFFLLYRLLEK